jgi:hypothetical protein
MTFSFTDDLADVPFECEAFGEKWNGHATPLCTLEQAREVVAYLNGLGMEDWTLEWDASGERLYEVWATESLPQTHEVPRVTEGLGAGLFEMGLGICWIAVG